MNLYFLHPKSSQARKMKSRLAHSSHLTIHESEDFEQVFLALKKNGGVLIYNLVHHDQLKNLASILTRLGRLENRALSAVVISDLKSPKIKSFIEGFAQTISFSGDVPAHDQDQLILKLVRRLGKAANAPASASVPYVLSYFQKGKPGTFILKGNLATKESFSIESKPVVFQHQVDKKSQPNQLFQGVASPEQKKMLVKDAVDSRASVLLSSFGIENEIQGYLFDYDESANKVSCQLIGKPEAIAKFRSESTRKNQIAFSISLRQARIFFACKNYRWLKESGLEIPIPEKIYFVQRRRNFRLLCYPQGTRVIFSQIGDSDVLSEIYDLSSTGLSILISKNELKRFKNAKLLSNTQFQVEGQTVTVDKMQLRQVQIFETRTEVPLYKLGYSFEEIQPGARRLITSHIDSLARAYFQKYVLSHTRK